MDLDKVLDDFEEDEGKNFFFFKIRFKYYESEKKSVRGYNVGSFHLICYVNFSLRREKEFSCHVHAFFFFFLTEE